MERRFPAKSHAAHIPISKDKFIMNELGKKSQKYIQIVKHYSTPATSEPDNSNWNYTPSCVDNSHYRAIMPRWMK